MPSLSVRTTISPDVVVAALTRASTSSARSHRGGAWRTSSGSSAAERASPGRKLKFGFNHRYHGSVMEAKQIVG